MKPLIAIFLVGLPHGLPLIKVMHVVGALFGTVAFATCPAAAAAAPVPAAAACGVGRWIVGGKFPRYINCHIEFFGNSS